MIRFGSPNTTDTKIPPDPVFLATAIEAVVRAGEFQMSRFGSNLPIDKKGTIDLVTEVDVEVERMFRALISERFPDHDVLGEELGGSSTGASHRWVFDPLDGTTNYAHGLPLFCSTLALEIDGQPVLMAREVQFDGKVVTLRDTQGMPMWSSLQGAAAK